MSRYGSIFQSMGGPALQAMHGHVVVYTPPDGDDETITCRSFVEDTDSDQTDADADTTQSRAECVIGADQVETPVRLATVTRDLEVWTVVAVERLADDSHRLELRRSTVLAKGPQARRVRR